MLCRKAKRKNSCQKKSKQASKEISRMLATMDTRKQASTVKQAQASKQ